MTTAAVCALALLRRLLAWRVLLLALLAGAGAGAAVLGLPAPALAADLFAGLVLTAAALLAVPLVAGVLAADRRGGLEALVALRPVGSLAWATGRLVGMSVGVVTLVLLVSATARSVGGRLAVPTELTATRMDSGLASVLGESTWRVPLPAGAQGEFLLHFHVVPPGPQGGSVSLDLARGVARAVLPERTVLRRQVSWLLPDLSPERGDLFVTIKPRAGLVLAPEPPRLVLGHAAIGRHGLPLPRGALAQVLFAAVVTLAAACSFRFETACLAGLLALLAPQPESEWLRLALVVTVCAAAVAGTHLQRRSALP